MRRTGSQAIWTYAATSELPSRALLPWDVLGGARVDAAFEGITARFEGDGKECLRLSDEDPRLLDFDTVRSIVGCSHQPASVSAARPVGGWIQHPTAFRSACETVAAEFQKLHASARGSAASAGHPKRQRCHRSEEASAVGNLCLHARPSEASIGGGCFFL